MFQSVRLVLVRRLDPEALVEERAVSGQGRRELGDEREERTRGRARRSARTATGNRSVGDRSDSTGGRVVLRAGACRVLEASAGSLTTGARSTRLSPRRHRGRPGCWRLVLDRGENRHAFGPTRARLQGCQRSERRLHRNPGRRAWRAGRRGRAVRQQRPALDAAIMSGSNRVARQAAIFGQQLEQLLGRPLRADQPAFRTRSARRGRGPTDA
jgi:hypothetical protein